MERRRMHIEFLWESQNEKDHQKHMDVEVIIILRRVLGKWDGVG
jgi:hypothetical protein